MKQQNLFTCQNITHEGEPIQGFCLNLRCQDSRSQFCLQCGFDPLKHTLCKKDLKGFGQIQSFITKFNQNILDLTTQLNKSYSQVKTKYEELSKQLENMKIQLVKISGCLSQQDYKQMKDNLQVIREWYQYLNNEDDIIKQNQIGTQLQSFMIHLIMIFNIKRIIQALDLDKGYQQIQGIQQENENTLQQGIQVVKNKIRNIIKIDQLNAIIILNKQKWQEANEKLNSYLKQSEKQLSFAMFFQNTQVFVYKLDYSIFIIIEMNQCGKGVIMKDQALKINSNLYRDLLEYSDLELRKTPKNAFILIAKSYALILETQYDLLQIVKRNINQLLNNVKKF